MCVLYYSYQDIRRIEYKAYNNCKLQATHRENSHRKKRQGIAAIDRLEARTHNSFRSWDTIMCLCGVESLQESLLYIANYESVHPFVCVVTQQFDTLS